MAQPHDRPSGLHAVSSDPLSDVLRRVKLTGAMFFMVEASDPWGMEVPAASCFAPIILPQAQHVVSYHIILQGSGQARVPGTAGTSFETGDIIVFPHADPYAMTSDHGSAALASGEEVLRFFRDMAAGRLPFVITEGGGGVDRARFICGFLGCDTRPFNPLFAELPRLLRIRRAAGEPPDLLDKLIDLTIFEAQQRRAGSDCIRLGLCELIFVEVLRRYLAARPDGQGGWLSGLRDPAIARALHLLHADPAHGWTVEELARRTGMSRSVLAERFTRLVGYAPMQYLTEWRMQIAAGLLADSDDKVAAIGRDVGYESEAAFSRTFKRIAGQSPAIWRQRMGHRMGG